MLGLRRPEAIAAAFKNADVDNNNTIDFDEFCGVVEQGDGGAFSKMIDKVQNDKAVRGIMQSRMRPMEVPTPLEDQLSETRAQRDWLSQFHLNDMPNQQRAYASGCFTELSIPLGSSVSPTSCLLYTSPSPRDRG